MDITTTSSVTMGTITTPIRTSQDGYSIKIAADAIDSDGLRKKITEILLEDPDSEIKNLSESFLVQYLEDAINDIENNPVLAKFFKGLDDRYKKLEQRVEDTITNSIPDDLRNMIYSSQYKLYYHRDAMLDCIDALSYLLGRIKDEERMRQDPYASPNYSSYELENMDRKLQDARNRIYYN